MAKGILQMWLSLGSGDEKVILDYAREPNLITRVLKSTENIPGCDQPQMGLQKKGQKGARLLALNMGGGHESRNAGTL